MAVLFARKNLFAGVCKMGQNQVIYTPIHPVSFGITGPILFASCLPNRLQSSDFDAGTVHSLFDQLPNLG